MPDQPKTPHRAIRVDDDLWAAFGDATDDRSGTIRGFIRWYVRQPGAKMPKRPSEEASS